MDFNIGKKKWKILFVRLKNAVGYCYYDQKVILIDSKLKDNDLKRVVIHETLHALRWSKSEKKVEQATEAILDALHF